MDKSGTQQAPELSNPRQGTEDNCREGNGRTQQVLTEHVAEHAGYVLDWHRIEPEHQNAMMAAAFEGELGPLHEALTRVTLPIFRGGAVDESPWPTEPTGPNARQTLGDSASPATRSSRNHEQRQLGRTTWHLHRCSRSSSSTSTAADIR